LIGNINKYKGCVLQVLMVELF